MKLSDLTAPDARATITVQQTAEVMGLSTRAVYEGVMREEIPSLRVDRRVIIPVARLLEWLGVKKENVSVIPPDELPELTPRAARASFSYPL
jgi:excisionase family DNA binding protein